MHFICMIAILTAGAEGAAWAADNGRQAGSSESQREAVTRQMEASLAAQRAAIARQTGATPAHSFFVLGPPTAGFAAPIPMAGPECAPIEQDQLATLVEAAAKRENLQPELLHSVARQESGLRPCAVSSKGAMGLMQLMPATTRDLGVMNPFDPKESIDGGAKLLRKYIDQYGSLPLALGAYNAGPARVNRTGSVPQIPETVDYVQRILSLLPASIVPE